MNLAPSALSAPGSFTQRRTTRSPRTKSLRNLVAIRTEPTAVNGFTTGEAVSPSRSCGGHLPLYLRADEGSKRIKNFRLTAKGKEALERHE